MSSIKEKCNNYLNTRVYNYIKAKKRKKAKLRDMKKFYIFKSNLIYLNSIKSNLYKNIFLGIDVKMTFINLHFIKVLIQYNYLYFYHENIKKLDRNEKLLKYFESVLANRFDLTIYKKEIDEDAYFAAGYGLTMNEEQKKEFIDFFYG